MSRWPRRIAAAACLLSLAVATLLGTALALGPFPFREPPPEAASAERAGPPLATVRARDGAPLAYRLYPGPSDRVADRVVVLVPGSTANSRDMADVAQALQTAGATVYAIDLRGHGGSGRANGQVGYIGQLDDDLADLLEATGLDRPGRQRTLAGYSAGGGLVLRIASGPRRGLFDSYLAIAPYVSNDFDVRRGGGNGWVTLARPRLFALGLLDAIGLPWFQDLPVARYARACVPDARCTPAYSYKLRRSLALETSWQDAMARIDRPTRIVTDPADLAYTLRQHGGGPPPPNPLVATTLLDGEHADMIHAPDALAAIASAWRTLAETPH